MPQFCNCGTELVPGARFCHKCGKPQREEPPLEPVREEDIPAQTAAPPLPFVPPEISFHNRVAVRVGFFAASLASLVILLPYLVLGCPVWLLAAGFFSVYLYRRRTGHPLSVRSGARMGWITGVFSSVIWTVFFTIQIISVASQSEGLGAFYRGRVSEMAVPQQSKEQALEFLQSPSGLAGILLLSLLFLFVFFTAIPTLGGALGAKVLKKD